MKAFTTNNNILILIFLLVFSACQSERIQVGLLASDQGSAEQDSLQAFFELHSDQYQLSLLSMDAIASGKSNLKDYDLLWYHRKDSSEINSSEKKAKQAVLSYLKQGGNLLLSSDAVRLLNQWKLEESKIAVSYRDLKDEGFGRKIGYHAFRSHPIFENQFGGAYVWHAKEDHKERCLGFFGEALPQAEGAKVIAVDWAYITYHTQRKLIWEMPYEKGKILAIGAYLNYSKPNFHQKDLDLFTQNCLNYLAGKESNEKARYWSYDPSVVQEQKKDLTHLEVPRAVKWKLPEEPLSIQKEASRNYYDLPGKRVLVQGKEQAGIDEIWTHPFMSMRDFFTSVVYEEKGKKKVKSLKDVKCELEIRSYALIRNYLIHPDLKLKEIITFDAKEPLAVVHYEWEGKLSGLQISCKSNLRYMWPYDSNALGNLNYHFSKDRKSFEFCNEEEEFYSLLFSSAEVKKFQCGQLETVESDDSANLQETDLLQAALLLEVDAEGEEAVDFCFLSGSEGVKNIREESKNLLSNVKDLLQKNQEAQEQFRKQHTNISTSDSLFNEGYQWALLGTNQFMVETPGLGTSLMAGYSTTARGWNGRQKVSGRPGYAWYFGRDAQWAGLALNAYGDFAGVRQILENFIRYQKVDGKIYHELSSSGSVHYDASDASPLFVILAADYIRHSGDLAFLNSKWQSIKKAMDYCYSTDTNGDALIEISNVGHGWLEGGKLYGSDTEFYLVGTWAKALQDAAYLANALEKKTLAASYEEDARKVQEVMDQKFWNPAGYYNYGMYRDGTCTEDFIILTSVPAYFDVLDHKKSAEMVKAYADYEFSSDWGTRMISDQSPLFNARSYHYGSVWPLFTGWTALAEYQNQRYNQAFAHSMSNLLNYRFFSPGRVVEVMNGSTYQPSGVTFHQCWSESMVLQPLLEGMLGYSPDALSNRVDLQPCFPFNWKDAKVEQIQFSDRIFSLQMNRWKGKITYDFKTNQPFELNFAPVLPLGTTVTKVLVDGKAVNFQLKSTGEYHQLCLDPISMAAEQKVEIFYKGGISPLPAYSLPEIGQESTGYRLLEQKLEGNSLKVRVQAKAGSSHQMQLFSEEKIQKTEGASIEKVEGDCMSISFEMPASKDKYVYKTIVLTFD